MRAKYLGKDKARNIQYKFSSNDFRIYAMSNNKRHNPYPCYNQKEFLERV